MDAEETVAEPSGNVMDTHQLRLMALLRELMRKRGHKGTARVLGVDHRTVAACVEGGALSRRMEGALERVLEADSGTPEAMQQERNEALTQRVEAIEQEVRETHESVDSGFRALREGHARALQGLERRLAQVEALRNGRSKAAADGAKASGAKASGAKADGVGGQPAARPLLRREHPELVTWEPAPDDEAVYGEAWPLVEEWRRLWAGHPSTGKGLSWLAAEERIRELEVAMLEEHVLTLPPEKEPLRGMWRHSQLRWRKAALGDVRRARAQRERIRWLRRVLTLGLWWE